MSCHASQRLRDTCTYNFWRMHTRALAQWARSTAPCKIHKMGHGTNKDPKLNTFLMEYSRCFYEVNTKGKNSVCDPLGNPQIRDKIGKNVPIFQPPPQKKITIKSISI